MGVIVIRNPPGEQFTNLTSLAIVAGVSFGTCYLRLRPLNFDSETLRAARGFGSYYATASPQEIFDQYLSLNRVDRERIEGEPVEIRKNVKGISIGINTGGSLDAVSDFLERPARMAMAMLRRSLRNRIVRRILAHIGVDAIGDVRDAGASSLTAGTSGGAFSMWDGGALHGAAPYSTLDLNIERVQNLNICVLQLGGGIIVGAGFNIMFMGNFPSLNTLLSVDGVFTTDIDNSLLFYIGNVLAHSECYAFIGDAAIGVILPGIDFNIIGS